MSVFCWQDLLGLALSFGCIGVSIYILVKGFRTMIKRGMGATAFRLTFLTAVIASLLYGVFAALSYLLKTGCENEHISDHAHAVVLFIQVFLYFALLLPCLLVTLLLRLQFTFNESVFRLRRSTTVCVWIGIAFVVGLNLLAFVFYVVTSLVHEYDVIVVSLVLVVPLSTILYVVLSFVLVRIFMKKLNELIISSSFEMAAFSRQSSYKSKKSNAVHSASASRSSVASGGSGGSGGGSANEGSSGGGGSHGSGEYTEAMLDPQINLTPRQTLSISQFAKYLVLAAFALGTTLFQILFWIGLVFTSNNRLTGYWFGYLNVVDTVCNVLCLYMQFSFGKRDYKRLCCCCDEMYRHVWQRKVKRKIKADIAHHHSNMKSMSSMSDDVNNNDKVHVPATATTLRNQLSSAPSQMSSTAGAELSSDEDPEAEAETTATTTKQSAYVTLN